MVERALGLIGVAVRGRATVLAVIAPVTAVIATVIPPVAPVIPSFVAPAE